MSNELQALLARVEESDAGTAQYWLTTKANAITELPDSCKPTYEAIQDMAREPEQVAIEIKTDERVDSVDTDSTPLPTENKHVLYMPNGLHPLEQKMARNRWEPGDDHARTELGHLGRLVPQPLVRRQELTADRAQGWRDAAVDPARLRVCP